jgi:hypothetical protein
MRVVVKMIGKGRKGTMKGVVITPGQTGFVGAKEGERKSDVGLVSCWRVAQNP